VGPVAAFTPWNFPINQVVRKLSCALAAGCSIIVKAPEETPAAPAELIRCFADAGVPAGPNTRRIAAMENFIGDAVHRGASLRTGGNRLGNKGNFFEPTVLTDVPMDSRIMHEEPFGPVAVIAPFKNFDDVV